MVQPAVQIDFFRDTPPGEATKYIVSRHTKSLVEGTLKDIEDYSLKVHLKEKSLN